MDLPLADFWYVIKNQKKELTRPAAVLSTTNLTPTWLQIYAGITYVLNLQYYTNKRSSQMSNNGFTKKKLYFTKHQATK